CSSDVCSPDLCPPAGPAPGRGGGRALSRRRVRPGRGAHQRRAVPSPLPGEAARRAGRAGRGRRPPRSPHRPVRDPRRHRRRRAGGRAARHRGVTVTLLTETPSRVLAVYAHPDDPEVSCGGALARWAARGAEVRLVVVNAGDKGSHDPDTDPAELTERRAAEVAAAADVLGLAGVDMLGIPDGEATNDT